jgi:hypothetical protein
MGILLLELFVPNMKMLTKAIRSTPAETAEINKFFHAFADRLADLYFRWQDEKEYEDFKDYADVMKSATPKQFTFVKANKSPFGFTLMNSRGLGYKLTMNSKHAQWVRA